MNSKQEAELIKLVIDFLIDAEHLYDIEEYSLKVYLNDNSTKVPITFQAQNKWLDNLTIDYYLQQYLEECGGYNFDNGEIILGCELEDFKKNGEIRYSFNQALTDKLNTQFAKNKTK